MKIIVPGSGSSVHDVLGCYDGVVYVLQPDKGMMTVPEEAVTEISGEQANNWYWRSEFPEDSTCLLVDPLRVHECQYWKFSSDTFV